MSPALYFFMAFPRPVGDRGFVSPHGAGREFSRLRARGVFPPFSRVRSRPVSLALRAIHLQKTVVTPSKERQGCALDLRRRR